ncbi:tyrosine-type recombinase/integrase [Chloroflexota bacterium]
METSILALEYLIQGFRLSCQAEGKSPRTVEWYTNFLLRFLKFLQSKGLPTIIDSIHKDHIRAFIRYLQTEARTPHKGMPLSGHTVQGYVRTLKAFFSWAMREEYLASNIMTGIPVPKAPNKIINSFNAEQIASLAAACQRENGNGYRNLAMLLLMLDCGLRVSEMVSIDVTDVDLGEGSIRVRSGKGAREIVVPVGSVVQKLLWKYINQSRPQPISKKITKLFLSCDGLPLTRSGVQQMLRRCGRRAGIVGVRCSPHTLRHTFAKNYLLNGGDTFSLQKILGHSSLASVRTYLNLFAVDIKKQHQRFSPVDNMADSKNLYPLLRASTKK